MLSGRSLTFAYIVFSSRGRTAWDRTTATAHPWRAPLSCGLLGGPVRERRAERAAFFLRVFPPRLELSFERGHSVAVALHLDHFSPDDFVVERWKLLGKALPILAGPAIRDPVDEDLHLVGCEISRVVRDYFDRVHSCSSSRC